MTDKKKEAAANKDSKNVKLVSPPGYGEVVPFDKNVHAGLGVRSDYSFDWCSKLNAVFLNAVEFSRAATDFPIAFTRDERSGEFLPVAILGLRKDENLFVDDKGNWKPLSYVPAYFRRHPFCIAEIPAKEGEKEAQRLVCVQADQLTESDTPLFTAEGEATPDWDNAQKLLEAVEGARQQTRALCKRLESLELLVGFDALATSRAGKQMRLQGMFRVDEQKLAKLASKDVMQMLTRGELRCLFAHLISLENFARLLDMTASTNGN